MIKFKRKENEWRRGEDVLVIAMGGFIIFVDVIFLLFWVFFWNLGFLYSIGGVKFIYNIVK